VLAAARRSDPEIEAIVLTGYATLESAISAVRQGAANYILKPGQPGEIERSVAEALARRQERREHSTHLLRLGQSLLQLAGVAPSEEAAGASGVSTATSPAHVINLGSLVLDQHRHSATLDSRALNLSPGEFALLTYMAQRHQQVISAQQLAREVMGYQCEAHEARDLIKARVWALRRKLEHDPTNPELLVSVRGVGYMLQVNK
jgi:DNA-binding response OmpR family regulator